MNKICFDKNWEFQLENNIDEFATFGFDKYSDASGPAGRFYDHNNWAKIDLPHDWALTLPRTLDANTFAGGYHNTRYHRFLLERHNDVAEVYHIGWYRKQFPYDPAWEGKRVFIEFEGVFRDSIVWANGVYLDRHTSGYTSFLYEITDHLVPGEENSIAVRVDSDQAEGWWYEGAGIYRHVHLLVCEPVYFQHNQTVIRTALDGVVTVSARLVNDTANEVTQTVDWRIADATGQTVATAQTAVTVAPYGGTTAEAVLQVDNPTLWSVESPYLYTLTLQTGAEQTTHRFGIRTVAMDPERGFLLNGKPVKLRGVCEHQDFGGVGVALSDNLNRYRIALLKQMGVNAYRCSHHAPSPVLLDICDELGVLVMDETRTFGTSPEAVRQLTAVIERDRNHPCVFMWSLGNEEFSIQDDAWGYRVMEKMTRLAAALDPTRPLTYSGCNGDNFIGCNGAAPVRGINYIRAGSDGGWVDRYHADHPEQPILGSEEASFVLSRGGAVNDHPNGRLDAYGNVTMPWGSTPKGWVKFYEERDWLAGGFMWTGFDYRGEPNPFYYTDVVSSFGTIDLCGMEKPPFYYYQAWWTEQPVLKLASHWNHREGDTVTVAVCTNCEEITLSLNGTPIETRRVERYDMPQFTLPFQPGVLAVEGRRNGATLRDELVTSGATASLRCLPVLTAETEEDVAIYQMEAYDEAGRFCPLAAEEVTVSVENGRLVGVGNGDPACLDYEQKPAKEEMVLVRSFSLDGGSVAVPAKAPNTLPIRRDWIEHEAKKPGYEDDFRLIATYAHDTGEATTQTYTARVTGVDGYAYVEFERLGGVTEVFVNGKKVGDNKRIHGKQSRNTNRPYRFYADFVAGENEIKVVSVRNAYDPPALSGYVKIGRKKDTPWTVKLHYGKARVFVKSDTPEQIMVSARLGE